MKTSKTIDLSRKRDFGDLFQDSVQFVVQNAQDIVRGLLFFVGPLFLVSAILNVLYFRDTGLANLRLEDLMNDPAAAFAELAQYSPPPAVMGLSSILSLSIFAVISAVFNSIILQYHRSPEGMVQIEGIWDDIKKFFFPYTGLTLLNFFVFFGVYMIGIMIVAIAINIIDSPVVLTLVAIPIAGVCYVMAVLPLTYIIRMNEDLSSMQSISRAFSLIKGHWWQTFLLILVMFLILFILTLGLYGMAGIFPLVFGEQLVNLGVMLLIGGLINSLISSLMYSVIYTGVGLQYFNLVEGTEHAFNTSQIDEIGRKPLEEED